MAPSDKGEAAPPKQGEEQIAISNLITGEQATWSGQFVGGFILLSVIIMRFLLKERFKKIKNVNTIIINGFLLILYFNKKKIMLHNKQGHGPLSHIKFLFSMDQALS